MAKQSGVLKLEGTLGDITFLKSQDGFIARQKGGVTANRIATDPAFQRTRENGFEFGRAGKAGKTLRNAFRAQVQKASDSRMVSRLTKEMMRAIQLDATNTRGQRNVLDGEVELLANFEFNDKGKLGTTLFAPHTATINRVTGAASIAIPSFIPANMVAAPAGTTHFKLFAGAAEVAFEDEIFNSFTQETATLPWDQTATAVINLAFSLQPNSLHPLFLGLGIEFMQRVNNVDYSLKNGSFNAFAIILVDADF